MNETYTGHFRSISSVSLHTETAKSVSTASVNGYEHDSEKNDISKVQIYNDLSEYELTLFKFVASVDKFKPDVNIAHQLIEVDKRLFKSLDQFTKYDEICTKLTELDDYSSKLNLKTKDILETLNECHDLLNTLPMLEQVEFEMKVILQQRSKINSKILLDYAMKLSKFTKIPPTLNKGSIGPNNFIWPAEDALRRGMLAMASIHGKKLTKLPNEKDESDVEQTEENQNVESAEESTVSSNEEKNNSIVFDGSHKTDDQDKDEEKQYNDDNMDLDLDLFDPDEF